MTPSEPDNSDRWRKVRSLVGLFGAPLAWVLQMSLCEPLAANSCFDYRTVMFPAFWQSLPLALKLFSIVFMVAGLFTSWSAWSMWREAAQETVGDGRARFLAKLALMSSFVFIVAIVFTTCAVFMVSPCRSR